MPKTLLLFLLPSTVQLWLQQLNPGWHEERLRIPGPAEVTGRTMSLWWNIKLNQIQQISLPMHVTNIYICKYSEYPACVRFPSLDARKNILTIDLTFNLFGAWRKQSQDRATVEKPKYWRNWTEKLVCKEVKLWFLS